LYDTAGIRDSKDPLEVEGMRRTEEVIRAADVIVYLVDGTRGMSVDDGRTLVGPSGRAPAIRVWNKADLPGLLPRPEGFLSVSAVTGAGLDSLEAEIVGAVLGGDPRDSSEPLVSSDRQRDLLDRALAALNRFSEARSRQVPPDLLAVDLADALDALGEMTGEVTSAEILDRMFSQFCVGK
jgi:tRNA modification GTPase